MRLWRLLPCVGLCAVTVAQAQTLNACADKDNDKACIVEVGVYRTSRFGMDRCIVYLRNLFDQFWIGFRAPAEITWLINRSNDWSLKLGDIVFDVPAEFVRKAYTDYSRTYEFKKSAGGAGTDHKYTLKVSDGKTSCELDPWVRNQ